MRAGLIATLIILAYLSMIGVWILRHIQVDGVITIVEPNRAWLAWEFGSAVALLALCLFAIFTLLFRR